MRSLLFVPADSEKKLAKGLESGADALILDLEDSVSAANKPLARETARAFLAAHAAATNRPLLMVRVNALDTGLTDDDLAAIVGARPDAIMLPKSESGRDVAHLDAKLTVQEALAGLPDGRITITVVATETAKAIFTLGTYQGASPRLVGLTWGAEDLSADIGAETNRGEDGRHTEPFRLARALCLMGAVAAGAQPIDTVFPAFRDLDGLRRECEEARRDGFTAKMAIHPAQVPVINQVFTPTPEAIAAAQAVVAAFAAEPAAGVVNIGGEMFDRPHLTRAERLLKRAGQ
ncbi:HpcH/HpaI aldolase/citrate lyase family protein [Phreatobacter cathodiphilus]|uniref:CoA ester lyase n=1 Tax=Phreatobacter cathodiphilus TaxID=1868589 RepID=A0A2S0N8X3_9HYPH|nr:CoA ester lyase [Phreatobacter cathodiphilus]AVO44585.1 CoA ester lyase [Phreatobacter cathodiphilus]